MKYRKQCPLCHSESIDSKFKISRFEKPFDIIECRDCGFQFQDIDPAIVSTFYDEGYYKGENDFSYLDERQNEKASRIVWKARMKRLARREQSRLAKKAMLDVGCSFGGLLQVGKEFGYRPYGVEVSDYSAGYARKRFGDTHIFSGNIEEIELPRDRFSIVTLIEVIEHLFDPKKALANIAQSMTAGGLLLIQTANMAGWQAIDEGADYHYYLPGHISYFTSENLRRLMVDSGFRQVEFIPGVEFGLLPKLRKSRHSFRKLADYANWWRIARYHRLSKKKRHGRQMTSSMVMLGWK